MSPLLELFYTEVETQTEILSGELLKQNWDWDVLMSASHALKGAAKAMELEPVVNLTHRMEDFFQERKEVDPLSKTVLLRSVEQIANICFIPKEELRKTIENQRQTFLSLSESISQPQKLTETENTQFANPFVRVDASTLSHLLGILGDMRVDAQALELMKREGERLRLSLRDNEKLELLLEMMESFCRKHQSHTDELFEDLKKIRLRPFSDLIGHYPHFIQKISEEKEISFECEGANTLMDRLIFDRLDGAIRHLIQNAVDHGIELPLERKKLGKNPVGKIKMEISLKGNRILLKVEDDGRGVDLDGIEALFQPGFTTSHVVSEISGRGYGLYNVKKIAQELGGSIEASSEKGKGFSLLIEVPQILSVIRSLKVLIGGEVYGIPLVKIDKVEKKNLKGVLGARILGCETNNEGNGVVILDNIPFIVDEILGEEELTIKELEPTLGKVPYISSGAIGKEGVPILMIDVEEFCHAGKKENKSPIS